MKIKLDENIHVRLAGALVILGRDVDTVASEGPRGRRDHVFRMHVRPRARLPRASHPVDRAGFARCHDRHARARGRREAH